MLGGCETKTIKVHYSDILRRQKKKELKLPLYLTLLDNVKNESQIVLKFCGLLIISEIYVVLGPLGGMHHFLIDDTDMAVCS